MQQAVVFYGFVVVVVSCLALTAACYRFKGKTPGNNSKTRKIAKEISIYFWDVITWFGCMAVIASFIYVVLRRAKSFYEYTLAQLVVYLIADANFLALSFIVYDTDEEYKSHSFIRVSLPLFTWVIHTSLVSGQLYIFRQNMMYEFAGKFADTSCYANGFWILAYLFRATWLQMVIIILAIIFFLTGIKIPEGSTKRIAEFIGRWCLFFAFALSLVALWFLFITILMIRTRAQTAFGSTYGDGAAGYGQILAIGPILQIFVIFFTLYRGKLSLTSTTR